MDFDWDYWNNYEAELTKLNNTSIGVKCAHRQYVILENWRAQILKAKDYEKEIKRLNRVINKLTKDEK